MRPSRDDNVIAVTAAICDAEGQAEAAVKSRAFGKIGESSDNRVRSVIVNNQERFADGGRSSPIEMGVKVELDKIIVPLTRIRSFWVLPTLVRILITTMPFAPMVRFP